MKAWRFFLFGSVILFTSGIVFSMMGEKGQFLIWLSEHRHVVADYYFYHVTKLGEPLGFIVIGVFLWMQSWRRMIIIPLGGLIVTIVSYLLKNAFAHERPMLYLNRLGWDGPMAVLDYHINTGHASFPSGHSMAAWALFTITAAMIRRTWVSITCLVLAASVSVSRVYLMVHFLQDVVAGAVIGFSLGVILYYFHRRWMEKNESAIAVDQI